MNRKNLMRPLFPREMKTVAPRDLSKLDETTRRVFDAVLPHFIKQMNINVLDMSESEQLASMWEAVAAGFFTFVQDGDHIGIEATLPEETRSDQ